MKVRIDGCYFPDGGSAMQQINTKETEWCCDEFKDNKDHKYDFHYGDMYFRVVDGEIDLGMGGFGNRIMWGDELKACPYCGHSLEDLEVWKQGHESINAYHEYMSK